MPCQKLAKTTRERTSEERERDCWRQSIDFLFPGTCFEQPMKYFHQSIVDVPWSTSVTYARKHAREKVINRLSYSIKQSWRRQGRNQISRSVFEAENEFIFSNYDIHDGCDNRQEMNWWCAWRYKCISRCITKWPENAWRQLKNAETDRATWQSSVRGPTSDEPETPSDTGRRVYPRFHSLETEWVIYDHDIYWMISCESNKEVRGIDQSFP